MVVMVVIRGFYIGIEVYRSIYNLVGLGSDGGLRCRALRSGRKRWKAKVGLDR